MQTPASTLHAALARLQAIRGGADDVLEACAGLPASTPRLVELLRAIGMDIGVLEDLWPQLHVLLQLPGATAAAGTDQEQAQPQQQPDISEPTAAAAAQALCSSVAAVLHRMGHSAKRQRLTAGSSAARWQYAEELPKVLAAIQKAVPQLQIEMMNSFSNTKTTPRHADEVRMLYPGVFSAAVVLAGGGRLEPVRVAVDAAEAVADIHGWSTSSHQCYQRVSALAARAAAFFTRMAAAKQLLSSPAPPADPEHASAGAVSSGGHGSGEGSGSAGAAAGLEALECLLLWLACYTDLFSRPCSATGKLLCWEPGSAVPLPPVVRPFKLTRDELLAAATHPALRSAYHAHAAPRDALVLQAAAEPAAGAGRSRQADSDLKLMDQLLVPLP